MKIGILQAGHVAGSLVARHGDFADMFQKFLAGHGFEFETWNVVDDEFPDNPYDAEGWLVTGSRYSVYEDIPWIRRLEEFLRDCFDNAVPVVGICFGHQVLAAALGGKVERHAGGWGVGRNEYDTPDGTVHLNSWHQDQVVEPPKCAEVVGHSSFCKFAMLSYGDRGLSMQPHPEFEEDFVADMIEKRGVGLVPTETLDVARSSLGKNVDNQQTARTIANLFMRLRRSGETKSLSELP